MAFPIRITQVALLTMLVVPTAASAQQTYDTATKGPPTLAEQYEAMTARLTADFWTARLNEYRREIDGMMSSSDLLELNELRARAALLLERSRRLQQKQQEESRIAMEATEEGTAVDMISPTVPTMAEAITESDNAEYAGIPVDTTYDGEEDAVDAPIYRGAEYYRQEMEQREEEEYRSSRHRLERLFAGDESAIEETKESSGDNSYLFSMEEMMGIQLDKTQIDAVAEWIARRYRTGIDELGARFLADMARYQTVVRDSSRLFFAAHRTAILEDRDESGWSLTKAMIDNLLPTEVPVEKSILPAFNGSKITLKEIESAMMIYHGQDLAEVLMLHPLANGFLWQVPSSSPLRQNSPNPASTRTNIPYTLDEPATDLLLQVLDLRGTLVATFDQGAREAGEHFASIDVATLPAGDYLYQLRVRTATGETLHTRIMSVGK